MRDGRVRGNDEVTTFHDCRRIQKGVRTSVKVSSQTLHRHVSGQISQLRLSLAFMKADKANAWNFRQGEKLAERE